MSGLWLGGSLMLLGGPLAVPARALLTFTVNDGGDAPDLVPDGICETAAGNHQCTLRAALAEANYLGEYGDILVVVPAMDIQLSLGEIAVTASYPVTIAGAGPFSTYVRPAAGAAPQRFLANEATRLTLRGLAIGEFQGDYGGAVFSSTSLRVERCQFFGNTATASGGSIYSGRDLEIFDSLFRANQADVSGAVEANNSLGGAIEIRRVIMTGNRASIFGGALTFRGHGTLAESYFADNQAPDGGGLWVTPVQGSVEVVNCTFTGNRATGSGGGVYAYPSADYALSLENLTVTGNDADHDLDGGGEGGGVFSNGPFYTTLRNSILSGNSGSIYLPQFGNTLRWAQDCAGNFASNGYNVMRANDEGLCSISGGVPFMFDPQLQPLDYNGGFSPTHALTPASQAVGAGDPSGCRTTNGALLATDQRGSARPAGAGCDLGAFEYGAMLFTDDLELGSTDRWSPAVLP